MQKYEEETARHRRFVELCDEIVRVNERICELRPVPEVKADKALAELKKTFDLESFEMGIRSSMHKIGDRMLETLINADGGDYRGRSIPCGKGHQYEFVEYRDKNLLTVLGLVAGPAIAPRTASWI